MSAECCWSVKSDVQLCSAVSPWRIDPDDIQVAEVDTFFIIPAVAGAALGPDMVWMRTLSRRLHLV